MNTWIDRGRVLRAGSTVPVLPARIDAPLSSSPFAGGGLTVDPRLTAPHLQQLLTDAASEAAVRGQAQGFAAGQEQGLAAGADRAAHKAVLEEQGRLVREQRRQDEHDTAVQTLQHAAEGFRRAEVTGAEQIEDLIVELALRLARAVLDRELAVSSCPGTEALARALRLAPTNTPLVARLHPTDLASVRPEMHPLVTLVGDPEIEPGGCIVEGAGRRIDAQLGEALARAAAAMS